MLIPEFAETQSKSHVAMSGRTVSLQDRMATRRAEALERPSRVAAHNGLHPLEGGGERVAADWVARTTARLRDFRDRREWAQFHSPRNLAVSVAIEAGELLQHFQWRPDDEVAAYMAARGEEVADELADVMVYLLQLADALGVDLPESVDRKIERNAERYPVAKARGTHARHDELR